MRPDLTMLQELVRVVHESPDDRGAAMVLADWYEERGLAHVRGGDGVTAVLPLEEVTIGGCEFLAVVSSRLARPFRLRKLTLHTHLVDHVTIQDVRAHRIIDEVRGTLDEGRSLLAGEGGGSIPGCVFASERGYTFDEVVPTGRRIAVIVNNTSSSRVNFSGALLGA